MGIFDDELGEGGEPWQIAQTVFDDLLSFMANNPHGNIDGPFDPITLRRRSSGNTLEIICDGPGTFRLKESIGFQTQVTTQPRPSAINGPIDRREMVRKVKAWINE